MSYQETLPNAESIGVLRNNSIRHEKGRTSQLVFVVLPSRQANDGTTTSGG
jgi:hypothetical protein